MLQERLVGRLRLGLVRLLRHQLHLPTIRLNLQLVPSSIHTGDQKAVINKFMEYKGGLLWGNGLFSRKNVSYPFAKLVVEHHHILLQALSSEFRLERSELVGISTKNRIFYKGILFKHSNCNVPKNLVFWTFQSEQILSDLNRFMQS